MCLAVILSACAAIVGTDTNGTKTPTTPTAVHHHDMGEWVVATEPTCTAGGERRRACATCDFVETKEIAKEPHVIENCRCTLCGMALSPSRGLEYTYLPDTDSYGVAGKGACTDTDIWVPDTYEGKPVTHLMDHAFSCEKLTSITLGDNVVDIGKYTFSCCDYLRSARLPVGLTDIPQEAFAGCDKLVDVQIPVGVTHLGPSAFSGCGLLPSVTLPDALVSVEADAFFCCYALSSIHIPRDLISIGDNAFAYCRSLDTITVDEDNSVFYAQNNCLLTKSGNVLIKGGNTAIIPDGTTAIGRAAFAQCSGLIDVVVPASVRSIALSAFYACDHLQSITLMEGVETLDDAIYRCDSLRSISLPASLTSISEGIGMDCPALESIRVAEGNPRYQSTNNCVVDVTTSTVVFGCKTSVIPDGVTTIGDFAFSGRYTLTEINIPASVKVIGVQAFSNAGLTEVTLPEGLTTIKDHAFCCCYNLVTLTIPSTVTTIERNAFQECIRLVEVCNRTSSPNDGALFAESGLTWSLRHIYSEAGGSRMTTPFRCYLGDEDVVLVQYVGDSPVVNVPKFVTVIGEYAFGENTTMVEITLPTGVTEINARAFKYCENLRTVYLPATVQRIGDFAFAWSDLKDIWYEGTRLQWHNIQKIEYPGWPEDCVIHCSDGDILDGVFD